jgi:cytochrome c oxidase assembly factor CtaG
MLAATAVAPGFWDWSLDPPLVLVLLAAALYAIGDQRTVAPARAKAARRVQRGCFYGGLAVLLIALASPIDALSEQLFWVHMIQHVLLLVVAAPLIVLAAPWNRLWRGLSLDLRRPLARGLAQGERTRWLRGASRALGSPAAGIVAFSGVLLAWHLPALFDATLRSATLHALEHTLFLATALMFWKQVIDSPPLRAPLSSVQRVAYLVAAMVVSWALAVVLALASHPLYAHYAHEAVRPGGISALTDQQLAAGVMWVPGSITFVIVIFAYVHRWLAPSANPASTRAVGLAGDH